VGHWDIENYVFIIHDPVSGTIDLDSEADVVLDGAGWLSDIVPGSLNGDAYLDLISGSEIFLGPFSGTMSLDDAYTTITTTSSRYFLAGDHNQDGYDDVFNTTRGPYNSRPGGDPATPGLVLFFGRDSSL